MLSSFFRWFETRSDPLPAEPPVKPPSELFAFLVHYARPFWKLLGATSLIGVAFAFLEVMIFGFIGSIVDWLSTADRATFWQTHGTQLGLMVVVLLVVMPILDLFGQALTNQSVLGNLTMRTRWQAHRYVLRQSLEFFQNDFAGRVATKVMQTSVGVRESVMKVTDVMVYVSVYFLSALVLFGSADLRLAAPLVVWFFVYVFVLRYFVPKLVAISRKLSDERSNLIGRVVDSYTNIATVKMFAHADREDAYAREGMDNLLQTIHDQMRLVTLLNVTIHATNYLLLTSVMGLGIWLWSLNAVTVGAVAFAAGLITRMMGMAHWILWEVASIFENIGVVQDGIQTIARDRAVVDTGRAVPLDVDRGAIRFENVAFNYGKTKGVIEDLSLDIAPGEKIGLIGRSGAGKSTLVNLLLRFYDLEGGRITIDGQDIGQVTQASLRAQIGMVTQDTSLLHRSIRDNIRYGRPDASDDQIAAAAARAAATEFIPDLEDMKGRTGYDAHVGERGVKLSGGQRQRIAIARVLLKDAPILVLDEATSALDSEVEAAIQEQFENLMQGKTVIAIAHRLSTIAAMDRLVVMDAGQIVEEGTHDELVALGGIYAGLWARQSGGFLLESKAAAAE